MYHWLGNYTMTDIEQVLACATGKETTFIITKHLNVLNSHIEDSLLLEDPYTPESLQGRSQDLSVYDALTSERGEKACR